MSKPSVIEKQDIRRADRPGVAGKARRRSCGESQGAGRPRPATEGQSK